MASLKCSNCGEGIHYHGVPEDIEYTYCKWDDWCMLESLKVNSDELDIKYEEMLAKPWKCPACTTFTFFDKCHVVRVYSPMQSDDTNILVTEDMESGLLFDDYLWDEITEETNPIQNILEKYKGYHWVRKNNEYMFIFDDKEMKSCIGKYKSIEISKE